MDEHLVIDGVWEKESKACEQCSKPYSITFRRHHCRLCRASVCGKCSDGAVAKTAILSSKSHRICLPCHEKQRQKMLQLQLDEAEAEANMSGLEIPEMAAAPRSHLTRVARTAKLSTYLFPILNRMRKAFNETEKFRTQEPSAAAFQARKAAYLDAHYGKEAPAYKELLLAMGGLYNKGAQLAAAQQMLLPARVVEELKTCFEDMPAREWKIMKHAICDCLGDGDEKLGKDVMAKEFREINEKPLAAASIGQVHMATLTDGTRVVVKVLYPEIRKNMWADLLTIKDAAEVGTKMLGLADMKDLIDTAYNEIASNFPRELDFHIEVTQMQHGEMLLKKIGANIAVPTAFPKLSGTQILTQTFLDGETFGKVAEKKDPVKMEAARGALRSVMDAMGTLIFKEGFFHADPHPGNVMLLKDGRAGMIDWGQCMNLTRAQRRRLCQIVIIMRTRCIELIIQGLQFVGFDFSDIDQEMAAAMMYIAFDTAINSPMSGSINDLASHFRSNPTKIQMPKTVPREVIFFARVVSCLRRDCEILEMDVSCIDLWAPIARQALHIMVYDGPIVRNPSQLRKGLQDLLDENKDEDDSSMWSPSRLILLLDTSHFDVVADGVKFLQANPEVGDACVHLVSRIDKAIPRSVSEAAFQAAVKHRHLVVAFVVLFSVMCFLIFLRGLFGLVF